MRRAILPLLAGIAGLLGSGAVTWKLYVAAAQSLETLLEARLRGIGQSAALLLEGKAPSQQMLHALMQANELDGAYVVSPTSEVLADATGTPRPRVDLLRVDLPRLRQAFDGQSSVSHGYRMGELHVMSAYFPIPTGPRQKHPVLALEAGTTFSRAREELRSALWGGVLLSVLSGLSLVAIAWGWNQTEQRRAQAQQRAAQVDLLSKMSAMAAHEIRNPLGIIRGTVELMRERLRPTLRPKDEQGFDDVLSEVERLRALTDDFMGLGVDRPLSLETVPIAALLRDVVAGVAIRYPVQQLVLHCDEALTVQGDPSRLRQIFLNLLLNAAQAQEQGTITVNAVSEPGIILVRIQDQGPGVPDSVRPHLFDPFFTRKEGGTGLGLALSKRLVERHGGTLTLATERGPGACFEVRLIKSGP